MSKGKDQDEELDELDDGPEDDKPMSFWDHLAELRSRVVKALIALLAGAGISWNFRKELLAILVKPFADSWREHNIPGDPQLHFSEVGGSFSAYLKLAMGCGLVLAAPVVFYQLWAFIAPGLYAREKRYVIPFITISTLLFIGGGYFGYAVAFPMTFGYLLGLSGDVNGVVTVTPTVMMEDYLGFVLQLFLGFGAIFEIPILLSFLARIGLVTHKKLIRWARYYIFLAFLISAILTPPDAASQLVMAIPACALYLVSIGFVYLFQRKEALQADLEREKQEQEAAALKEEQERAEREAERKAARKRA